MWSVGVIFYQMLIGERPFGEGMSQENIFRNRTIELASEVTFPAKPQISNEAKAFIKDCLTRDQDERMDVLK